MFKQLMFLCFMLFLASTSHAQAKKYIVALDATWPPMEYVDENRNIIGYSVDYINAVAREAGFSIECKSVAWEAILAGLVSKKYDIVSSSVTILDERKKIVDFSEPYYETRQALIVPKHTGPISSLTDMKGKQLGSQIGTTGFMAVKATEGVLSKSFDEIGMAMAALAAGRIDGVVCDDATAKNYILENPDYAKTMTLALILPSQEPEYYGFVVAKGNKELLDLINKGIEQVKAKGIDQALRKKWIGN